MKKKRPEMAHLKMCVVKLLVILKWLESGLTMVIINLFRCDEDKWEEL